MMVRVKLAMILWSLATTVSGIPPNISHKKLVWEDTFNGPLDSSKWVVEVNCDGGGNGELQCYTNRPKNVKADHGLRIKARPEKYENRNYTSARLHSRQSWKFGYFEARAKLPKGKHLWPAIWMMPKDNSYGQWPRSGEIDIVESRGQQTTYTVHTIHYGVASNNKKHETSGMKDRGVDFSQDFHVFGLEWTAKKMTWFIDDKEVFSTSLDRFFNIEGQEAVYKKKGQPFDKPFFWVLNVAVGGAFIPSNVFGDLTPEEAKSWPKPTMEVKYLKVFQ